MLLDKVQARVLSIISRVMCCVRMNATLADRRNPVRDPQNRLGGAPLRLTRADGTKSFANGPPRRKGRSNGLEPA